MNGLRWLITTLALSLMMLLPSAANAQAGFYVDPYGNAHPSGYYDAWGNYVAPGAGYNYGYRNSYYGPRHGYWNYNRLHDRYDWRDMVNSIIYNIR